MNDLYLVLDLEATCDQPQLEHCEIIEIGAVIVRGSGEVLASFESYVRPVVNPVLTAFCTELTTIGQHSVDTAPYFHEACSHFDEWVERCEADFGKIESWGSWGRFDYAQFIRNAELVKAALPKFMRIPHSNLKQVYGHAIGVKRGPGLKRALAGEQMQFIGTQHRALSDVFNIVRLLPIALGKKPSSVKKTQNDSSTALR